MHLLPVKLLTTKIVSGFARRLKAEAKAFLVLKCRSCLVCVACISNGCAGTWSLRSTNGEKPFPMQLRIIPLNHALNHVRRKFALSLRATVGEGIVSSKRSLTCNRIAQAAISKAFRQHDVVQLSSCTRILQS